MELCRDVEIGVCACEGGWGEKVRCVKCEGRWDEKCVEGAGAFPLDIMMPSRPARPAENRIYST